MWTRWEDERLRTPLVQSLFQGTQAHAWSAQPAALRSMTRPRSTESSGMCQWGWQLPLLSLSWHGYDPSFCISIKRMPSSLGAQQSPPPHLTEHQVASKSFPFTVNYEIPSTGSEASAWNRGQQILAKVSGGFLLTFPGVLYGQWDYSEYLLPSDTEVFL
ncbi:hypothetical protein CB1_000628003 [Camelus ferus]|nr:hypothetical protein CB1_000628003 [Camelus ferus]